MHKFNPVEIIRKKRDGIKLTSHEIKKFINGFLQGSVHDYQVSAFLMAVYYKGLDDEETLALTESYIESGEKVNLSFIQKPKIDKHSTGGVGDKTSLILAPLLACFDVAVPMMSGRGLGHTGGTLDKLESIPGFRTNLHVDEFKRILNKIGVCMIGQTDTLTPADKKIYELRDVTATVENISLITASIVSKKISEGSEGIVYDVKTGSGSTLPDYESSRELAMKLLDVTRKFGKRAIAVLTEMDSPLGYAIGNWCEVEECIAVMNRISKPGSISSDLIEVTMKLAGVMLMLAGKCSSVEEGTALAGSKLINGECFKKFLELVEIQGGDTNFIKNPSLYKKPKYTREVKSEIPGCLKEIDALMIGYAAVNLGCGRKKVDDVIDYSAGIKLMKKPGDLINKGDTIFIAGAESEDKLEHALDNLENSIVISKEPVPVKSKILQIID